MNHLDQCLQDTLSCKTLLIVTEVNFCYLKPHLITADIFSTQALQKAEAGKANVNKMRTLCDYAKTLNFDGFKKFINAIAEDYKHVADKIWSDFEQRCGYRVATPEKTAVKPETSSSQPSGSSLPPVTRPVEKSSSKPNISQPSHGKHPKTSVTRKRTLQHDNPTQRTQSGPSASGGDSVPSGNMGGADAQARPQRNLAYIRLLECRITAEAARCLVALNDNTPDDLSGKYDSKFDFNPLKMYRMDSQPRGCCLIINNEKFDNCHWDQRVGSIEDTAHIISIFKYMGFSVSYELNKTAAEMKEVMEIFAKSSELEDACALAVVIFSHGTEDDCIFGIDGAMEQPPGQQRATPREGTYIKKIDLIQIFNHNSCVKMREKPKLFILQACRGALEDKIDVSPRERGLVRERPEETVSDAGNMHLAATADMCYVYATSTGHVAYRDTQTGSPFVQKFVEYVRQHAHLKEFSKIMRELMDHFSHEKVGNFMTMPEFSSQLTKSWYLNPKPLPL